jgi:uncharacterized phosphosugar-binding protein
LPEGNTQSYGYIANIFESNQLRKGDILFVGSVSGKSANVVELAIQGRTHGLKVIAVTAYDYSSQLISDHPSGKHLMKSQTTLNNYALMAMQRRETAGLSDLPGL